MLRYAYIHNCGCYHVFHLNACCCRYWTPFIVYLVYFSEYVEYMPLKHWACSFLQHCLTYLVLSSFAVLTLRMPAVVVCMPSVLVYALTRNCLTWVIISMLRRPSWSIFEISDCRCFYCFSDANYAPSFWGCSYLITCAIAWHESSIWCDADLKWQDCFAIHLVLATCHNNDHTVANILAEYDWLWNDETKPFVH